MTDCATIRVLLIEDNEDHVHLIRQALKKEPIEIETLADGRLALEYLCKPVHPPDVVLLDYRLPSMDGIEILREMERLGLGYAVIFLTADSSLQTVISAMRAGALDFMPKHPDFFRGLPDMIRKVHNLFQDRIKHRIIRDELRFSEDRHRILVENMKQGVLHFTPDFFITYMNSAICEITGVDFEPGLSLVDLSDKIKPSNEDGRLLNLAENPFSRAIDGKTGLANLVMGIENQRDGHTRWVRVDILPMRRQGSDDPVLYYGVLDDITERKTLTDQLRTAQTEMAVILDSMSEPLIHFDTQRRLRWCNKAALAQTGRESGTELGISCREFWGLNHFCNPCLVSQAMDNGDATQAEMTMPSGKTWLIKGYPVFDKAGRITGTIEICQDLSERIRAEKELRSSERRLQSILDATSDGYWDHDFRAHTTQYSANFWRGLGYKTHFEAPVEPLWTELIHPDDLITYERSFDDHLRGLTSRVILELRLLNSAAVWQWVLLKIRIVERDRMGNPLRLLGTYSDIRAKISAEDALQRLGSVVEQMSEYVVITDCEGRINYCNPAFESITGYTRDEVLGLSSSILKSGMHDTDFYRTLWDTITRGDVWRGHLINRRKDGSLFEEDATITPIRDKTGKIINFVGVKRDVTNERRLQSHLNQAQKMEAIGTLAGGIAHDFNNVLSVILGYSELAKLEVNEGTGIFSCISEISKAGNRARELVGQILAFSRQGEQEKRPIQISSIVKEVLKMLRASLPATIRFSTNLDNKCIVLADPTQIHQIVMNLCTNAYHAMREEGGVLSVSMEDIAYPQLTPELQLTLKPGNYMRLKISDTGTGMTPEIRARIFEPYFTTKAQGDGTGLGLYIVHEIIRSYDGLIDVVSEPGQGTTFSIYLPSVNLPAVDARDVVRKKIDVTPATILAVDDEAPIARLHQKALEYFGHRVLALNSSIKALEEYLKNPEAFDIVLTDMTMPGITGLKLAEEVLRIRPAQIVIMCTGFSDRINPTIVKQSGIRELVMKPVNYQNLVELIERELRGLPPEEESTLAE